MSFIYSCIGDNSPENREHLEKIGMKGYNGDHQFIIVHRGHYSSTDEYMKVHYPCVSCVNNPALFQAVTAIRKNSGIHQLYTDGVKWVESDIHDLLEIPDYLIGKGFDINKTHKATLSELQAHFQRV